MWTSTAYLIQCPAGEDKDRPPDFVFFRHILTKEYTELQLQAASVLANNDMHEEYLCLFQIKLYDNEMVSLIGLCQ